MSGNQVGRRTAEKAKIICPPPSGVDIIIKEVYGLTALYRYIYAVKGTILSHFSRTKMTLKTTAKVNKLDAGTPSCTQPPKPFSIVSMQYSQH